MTPDRRFDEDDRLSRGRKQSVLTVSPAVAFLLVGLGIGLGAVAFWLGGPFPGRKGRAASRSQRQTSRRQPRVAARCRRERSR